MGLTNADAAQRLARRGPNVLLAVPLGILQECRDARDPSFSDQPR